MPERERMYDLIVIGTGNAGMAMALTARHAGWNVAIVDELPYGGTCAVKGCIPKKVLTGTANLVQKAHIAQNHGITGTLALAWPDLIRFKRTFTDPVPTVRKEVFAKEGIDAYHAHARFLGKNTLSAGTTELQGRFIGIATGAVPQNLGIPGGELMHTSNDFLAMESLPRRIVFIGGGFISFEFAHVASAAGSSVTILHRSNRILKEFDAYLAAILLRAYRDRGIGVQTDMPVKAIERVGDHLRVRAGERGDQFFDADLVVHGAGRVPNFAGLDLEAGGVAVDERGITINKYLQSTSNPSVYVAGDANVHGIALSPVATMEGKIAARNMLHGNTVTPDYSAVPSVVFTDPVLASVGLREDQAEKRGIDVIIHRQETPEWISNRQAGITHSGYTILTEKKSGKILGAHILGYNADEMINVFALAIRTGSPLADLQEIPWAYPTGGYDIVRIR